MNIPTRLKKILVLGVATVGVIFLNKILFSNRPELGQGFAVQPLSKGFSLAEPGIGFESYKNKLKSYPDPDKYKTFEYKNSDLEFSGECSDRYYTILIYNKGVDYRANPASAKFNQAFECPANGEFKFKIDSNIGLIPGKYYIIVADQGKEGGWYNPR